LSCSTFFCCPINISQEKSGKDQQLACHHSFHRIGYNDSPASDQKD
jgi:hypothetical protein